MNTEQYVIDQIAKLEQLIEKTGREIVENSKIVEAKKQAIVQWTALKASFEQDLEKLNG